MPLASTEAIILQAFAYSETSKILRMLTVTHGVQSVIAKGALRPKSRYGGVLEPFTEGVTTFYYREHRDLHNLSEFELVRSRQRLGRDLVRFGAASLIAEIVLRSADEQPAPEVFRRTRDALNALESAAPEAVEQVALAQAWALVVALGFAPSLDQCVSCGSAVAAERDVFFDYGAGGVLCGACGGGSGAGRLLPASARADLASLCRGEPVPITSAGAHWQVLSRFLAYHVVDAGSLRSLSFLTDAVANA